MKLQTLLFGGLLRQIENPPGHYLGYLTGLIEMSTAPKVDKIFFPQDFITAGPFSRVEAASLLPVVSHVTELEKGRVSALVPTLSPLQPLTSRAQSRMFRARDHAETNNGERGKKVGCVRMDARG